MKKTILMILILFYAISSNNSGQPTISDDTCLTNEQPTPQLPDSTLYKLMSDLRDNENIFVLCNIAQLGHKGYKAGPLVTTFLNHQEWEPRVFAARTLGFIGYSESTEKLIELSQNNQDWRVAYAASESLGRLKYKDALPALKNVAQNHWYAKVRRCATKAIFSINNLYNYPNQTDPQRFSMEFFLREDIYDSFWGSLFGKSWKFNREKRPGQLSYVELKEITYSLSNNSQYKISPSTGIAVEGGFIVGDSRGEWGGELMFIDSHSNQQLLAFDNILSVFRWNNQIIAIAGCDHMGANQGELYITQNNTSGKWETQRWFVLPGAPYDFSVTPTGKLKILCQSGVFVVNKKGAPEKDNTQIMIILLLTTIVLSILTLAKLSFIKIEKL